MPPDQSRGYAIVSGASSGIGFACAKELARRGQRLVLIARDAQRLETARIAVEMAGAPEALAVVADVTDAGACASIVNDLNERQARIEWLVTSAGDVEPGMFDELEMDAHRRQMDLNYFGTLNLTAPVARHMVARGSGRIVLVSSAAAVVGIAGYSAYGASKFAVRGLAEALRVELEPRGVLCSVAFPPDTQTPQLERERARRPAITAQIAAGAPMAEADDVAARMIADAARGMFILAPTRRLRAFILLGSLCAPLFRWRQRRLLKRHMSS
jgi:3-dehydrosphinganine reductase